MALVRVRTTRPVRAALAAVGLAAALAVGFTGPAAQADTAPPSGVPATVSADGLPTVQIGGGVGGMDSFGVVWAQVTVGNIVYAAGNFTQAWPAGQVRTSSNTVSRPNILSYNITTGALTTFRHTLNAQALAIAASKDGKTVYVGGLFTSVDGVKRNHMAAFSTATGALTGFAPNLDAKVNAIAVSSTTVYAGGVFGTANGNARGRLAAFAMSTGALQSWAPSTGGTFNQVQALAVSPDQSRVIIGGHFTSLDSVPACGLGAALTSQAHGVQPFLANVTIQDCNQQAAITSLATDATQVYGTGYDFGEPGNNLEGTFAANPNTGRINWVVDCHGDTYGVYPIGAVAYTVSHAHDCSWAGGFPETNPRTHHHALAFTTAASTRNNRGPDDYGYDYSAFKTASMLVWFPTFVDGGFTGQSQAAWSVTGNSRYVSLGGEFPSVNGVPQHGLVRFAVASAATNKRGPVGASLRPSLSRQAGGKIKLTWGSTWDQDNRFLTYRVYRNGVLVHSTSVGSNFWSRPAVTYTNTNVVSGTKYTYRIDAYDPFGNHITGTAVSITG